MTEPEPVKIVIEITPETWDHIDENQVKEWVFQSLIRSKISKYNMVGGKIAIKRVKIKGDIKDSYLDTTKARGMQLEGLMKEKVGEDLLFIVQEMKDMITRLW